MFYIIKFLKVDLVWGDLWSIYKFLYFGLGIILPNGLILWLLLPVFNCSSLGCLSISYLWLYRCPVCSRYYYWFIYTSSSYFYVSFLIKIYFISPSLKMENYSYDITSFLLFLMLVSYICRRVFGWPLNYRPPNNNIFV